MTAWDLQEWREVVIDLLAAMEAHDIAHFVEAGHPENHQACVAASDALQVAQRRALAMLEQTKEPERGMPLCTCLSISRDPLCWYHGNVDIAEIPAGTLAYLQARLAFYERHTDTQANELVTVRRLYEQALDQRDSALTELTDTRRFWQAAKDALQAEKSVSQEHFDFYISAHNRCEMARAALERIATGMDLRFAETKGMAAVARDALERTVPRGRQSAVSPAPDYVDWGSGELLAMAALDHYPIDDGLPKSTSVVFRIHQLGRAYEQLACGPEAVTPESHTGYKDCGCDGPTRIDPKCTIHNVGP